jgi:hypothetical protein
MSSRSNAASPSPPHASGAEKATPKAINTNGANNSHTNIAIGLLCIIVIASFGSLQYQINGMRSAAAEGITDAITLYSRTQAHLLRQSSELLKHLSAMPDFLDAEALAMQNSNEDDAVAAMIWSQAASTIRGLVQVGTIFVYCRHGQKLSPPYLFARAT